MLACSVSSVFKSRHKILVPLAIPYGYNRIADPGFLSDEIFVRNVRAIRFDTEKMIAHFSPGIEIPLRPFFGSMGVAPPKYAGKISSAPPWIHAGNLDNKELVAGTTLFIPVHVKGTNFLLGRWSCRAGQWCGGFEYHPTRRRQKRCTRDPAKSDICFEKVARIWWQIAA